LENPAFSLGSAMTPDPICFIAVIIGTPRQGRVTESAANFVFGEVSKRSDVETE